MSLLDAKNERTGFRVVGASLPSQIHNYITLFTLAKGVTKSRVIKTLFEDWIAQQRSKQTDYDLVIEIVRRVNLQWKKRKALNKTLTHEQFKETLEKELTAKGLLDEYIQIILKGLDNGEA